MALPNLTCILWGDGVTLEKWWPRTRNVQMRRHWTCPRWERWKMCVPWISIENDFVHRDDVVVIFLPIKKGRICSCGTRFGRFSGNPLKQPDGEAKETAPPPPPLNFRRVRKLPSLITPGSRGSLINCKSAAAATAAAVGFHTIYQRDPGAPSRRRFILIDLLERLTVT